MAKKLSRVRKPRKFTGELAEPIIEDMTAPGGEFLWSLSDDQIDRAFRDGRRRILRRQIAKLGKLLKVYKIDPKTSHRWLSLSLALANDFVPGMRGYFFDLRTKHGRPTKWKGRREVELVQAVDRIKAERGKGIADAIRVLQTREPAAWGSLKGIDAQKRTASLQARYYEARQRLRRHDMDNVNVNEK